jgi:hypothetical protein
VISRIGSIDYKFIKEVGKLISDKTMERRSTSFSRQSISMEIQKEIVPAFWVQWKIQNY